MGWIAAIGQRHAAITQPPPPGGDPEAGPLAGAQAIRDDATPDPVVDPGGGISFTTRADLQTKIDANPANSIFVHAAGGTETWTTQINCGTKHPRIYFLGLAGSTATTLDGQGTNVTGFNSTSGTGYEIHGGKLTGFGALADVLTVTHRAIRMAGPGLIEDIVATNSHIGIGITADGDNTTIRRCHTHGNHRYGIAGSGAQSTPIDNLLIERCRIQNNNTAQLSFDDASGTKFVGCTNTTIRYCYADDNYGWGIWPDGFNENFTIQENVTEDNWRGGIFYELSHGGAVISRNACYRDCAANTEIATRHTRAAILVSESDGTIGTGGISITRNIVDTAAWPIMLFDNDNRSMVCKDVDVTLNDVWLRSSDSRVGGDDGKLTKTMNTDPTFTWVDNTYHVLSLGTSNWYWPTASNASLQQSFPSWEALSITSGETRITI